MTGDELEDKFEKETGYEVYKSEHNLVKFITWLKSLVIEQAERIEKQQALFKEMNAVDCIRFAEYDKTITDLNKQIEEQAITIKYFHKLWQESADQVAEHHRQIEELKAEKVCPKGECKHFKEETAAEDRTVYTWCLAVRCIRIKQATDMFEPTK